MSRFQWMFVAVVVLAGALAVSMYNKPHKDYASEAVAKSWTAEELLSWYTSHPAEDHAQWQETVVAVSGTVTSANERGVILDPGVVVTWEQDAVPESEPTGAVRVKGRVVGFDALFGEVRLDHARLLP